MLRLREASGLAVLPEASPEVPPKMPPEAPLESDGNNG